MGSNFTEHSGYCGHCQEQVLMRQPVANHVLHLIVTIFLCGMWIPVWLFLIVFPGPPRCSRCGSEA